MEEVASGEYNAYAPHGGLSFTEPEWEELLRKKYPDFNGTYSEASRILCAMTKGIRWMSRRLLQRGLTNTELPRFAILSKELPKPISIGYDHNSDSIFISKNHLEQYSYYNQKSTCKIERRFSEEFVFHGNSLLDFYKVSGVEECHHSIYKRYKGRFFSPHADDLSLSEYDALDHEFRALKWQIRFAIDQCLPRKTINCLRWRLKNAKSARKKRAGLQVA